MVAGSDEAAFSMQEKGAPLSGDKSPQVGFKATGQAPDIDNIPTNEQDVNIETEKKYSAMKQKRNILLKLMRSSSSRLQLKIQTSVFSGCKRL